MFAGIPAGFVQGSSRIFPGFLPELFPACLLDFLSGLLQEFLPEFFLGYLDSRFPIFTGFLPITEFLRVLK